MLNVRDFSIFFKKIASSISPQKRKQRTKNVNGKKLLCRIRNFILCLNKQKRTDLLNLLLSLRSKNSLHASRKKLD